LSINGLALGSSRAEYISGAISEKMNKKIEEGEGKEVEVRLKHKSITGTLKSHDAYLNLIVDAGDKRYFIRGDKIEEVRFVNS